jgi:hypothetical protein
MLCVVYSLEVQVHNLGLTVSDKPLVRCINAIVRLVTGRKIPV